MTFPLQITFKNMAPSTAIEARVQKKAGLLEHFSKHISRCHVTVEAPHHHHQQGKIYQVHILLAVPGKEIIVNRAAGKNHAHEDFYVALRDAFDAAKRQVQDYTAIQHHKVKHHKSASLI